MISEYLGDAGRACHSFVNTATTTVVVEWRRTADGCLLKRINVAPSGAISPLELPEMTVGYSVGVVGASRPQLTFAPIGTGWVWEVSG